MAGSTSTTYGTPAKIVRSTYCHMVDRTPTKGSVNLFTTRRKL